MSEEQPNVAQNLGRVFGRIINVLAQAMLIALLTSLLVLILRVNIESFKNHKNRAEVQRAQNMVRVLGSPENFVEYEKAQN